MRLDSGTLAKAASAALMVFGRHHPLTATLYMAMADPTDLADVRRALDSLPADFFAARLAVELPAGTQQRVGGAGSVPTDMAARWALLWGLGLSGPRQQGEDRVPIDLIRAPWQAPQRNSEKYLEPAAIAIWAAAEVGQKDHATLQAIVNRLDQPGDPD